MQRNFKGSTQSSPQTSMILPVFIQKIAGILMIWENPTSTDSSASKQMSFNFWPSLRFFGGYFWGYNSLHFWSLASWDTHVCTYVSHTWLGKYTWTHEMSDSLVCNISRAWDSSTLSLVQFKCLVIFGLKAMASQSIHLIMNSQFLRPRHGNVYPIPPAFTDGNLW